MKYKYFILALKLKSLHQHLAKNYYCTSVSNAIIRANILVLSKVSKNLFINN